MKTIQKLAWAQTRKKHKKNHIKYIAEKIAIATGLLKTNSEQKPFEGRAKKRQ